jgi:dipeptidyl aminopeptidase/acylaminoacyl peptidase
VAPEVDYTRSLQHQPVNAPIAAGKDYNLGYDTNPAFSPDGRYIAWQSMERDGYESDRNRLCILDTKTGQKTYVTETFQSNVDAYTWAADSKTLYFVGTWHGTTHVYSTNLKGQVQRITDGQYDYGSVALCGKQLLCERHSMSESPELFLVSTKPYTKGGNVQQLTHENQYFRDAIDWGTTQEFIGETVDGKPLHSWIVLPPHFDASKKYPTLLFCEGGPQSPVSQFWSYRWNMMIMAANGYVVVAPNRRGLPGFGMEWLEEISTNYTGRCMDDYKSAIDQAADKFSFIDRDRLGCVGASFGGFSVYWLAGNHDGRFKCFIAHDGIFNLEQQYLETEEMWFANWDLGGAPWLQDEAIQRTYARSPHKFVDRWDTPILCIQGEKDYRIVTSQAMAAYNAATYRGIPAEFLVFPDENHWVLRPQNGVLWQRTYFAWLDRWLKK